MWVTEISGIMDVYHTDKGATPLADAITVSTRIMKLWKIIL